MSAGLQGNNSERKLTRFRILALLSSANYGLTCKELAKASGQDHFSKRSFLASLTSRLRRLRRWGLVRRKLDRFNRPMRARRIGVYRWRISRRGLDRLAWARTKRKV